MKRPQLGAAGTGAASEKKLEAYACELEQKLEARTRVPEFVAYMEQHLIEPARNTLVGRTALEGRTVHIPDVRADPVAAGYCRPGRMRAPMIVRSIASN